MARIHPRSALLAGALAALTCAIGIGTSALAADYTMKIGVLSVNDAQEGVCNAAKAAIEKATNGRVEVKVYPRGVLGSAAAHIQGLQTGTIEGFLVPIDFFAGVDPRAGVFSSPFLFKDRHQADRVAQSPEIYNEVMNLFADKGIIGGTLGTIADGKYIARNPLRKVSDFQGKKMRVNATDAERERMKRLGATGIPMNLADMVTALQSGVIDGTMSGISIHVNFKLDTISKVLLETNDTMLISYLGVSKKWLDSMPADLREKVVAAMRGLGPEFARLADRDDQQLGARWRSVGGSFIKFSPEDQAEMKRLTESVGDDVTKNNPVVNAYYKKVKAVSAKY
jgi:C4-dicarboxylate-binding protein DctP